jgi:hypothetical protein
MVQPFHILGQDEDIRRLLRDSGSDPVGDPSFCGPVIQVPRKEFHAGQGITAAAPGACVTAIPTASSPLPGGVPRRSRVRSSCLQRVKGSGSRQRGFACAMWSTGSVRTLGRGCVKTHSHFFKMGSGYWLRDKASPSVLMAIIIGRNSWVEVGNIFVETQIFAFSHSLGQWET